MEAETGNKKVREARYKKNMRLLAVETSGRRERYRENGTMLGSCLPLGWTLVPFRLRLEWHLANVPHLSYALHARRGGGAF